MLIEGQPGEESTILNDSQESIEISVQPVRHEIEEGEVIEDDDDDDDDGADDDADANEDVDEDEVQEVVEQPDCGDAQDQQQQMEPQPEQVVPAGGASAPVAAAAPIAEKQQIRFRRHEL